MSNLDQCRDVKKLNVLCAFLLGKALDRIKFQGVTPLVVETYRSQERQEYLYSQGRTRKGKKCTWTLNSIHTHKNAVDLVPVRSGVAIWDANDKNTKVIINAMTIYGFEAGANWGKNADSPHFQIKGVADDAKTFSMKNTNSYITAMIQLALNRKINANLKVDGKWGEATTLAVNKFRKKYLWKQNGQVGVPTLKKLLA